MNTPLKTDKIFGVNIIVDNKGIILSKEDVDLLVFQLNNWDKMKQYLKELLEAHHEITENEFMHSTKFGSRELIEVQTFLNEIK